LKSSGHRARRRPFARRQSITRITPELGGCRLADDPRDGPVSIWLWGLRASRPYAKVISYLLAVNVLDSPRRVERSLAARPSVVTGFRAVWD
jgi:hypothetical protein